MQPFLKGQVYLLAGLVALTLILGVPNGLGMGPATGPYMEPNGVQLATGPYMEPSRLQLAMGPYGEPNGLQVAMGPYGEPNGLMPEPNDGGGEQARWCEGLRPAANRG